MDDPLFLLMQGVWLLAAGMYPLGFLFGTCSACCGCPPECSKCTQFWNQFNENTFCKAVEEFKVVIDGYGTLTGEPTNILGFGDCLDGVDPELTIEGIECNGEEVSILARMYFDVPQIFSDECGCEGMSFDGGIRFFVDDSEWARSPILFTNNISCDGETFVLDVPLTGDSGCIAEFLDSLDITAEVTFAPCDCGACCDGECEDDVAEGYCENWAGVGTACDDDPPPCGEEE